MAREQRQLRWQTTLLFVAASHGLVRLVTQLARRIGSECRLSASGWSPLHVAVRDGHLAVVDALVKAQADVSAITSTGRSPVWIAADVGRADIVALLVGAQASIDAQTVEKGESAFHLAVSRKDDRMVQLLAKAQADVSLQKLKGEPAIFIAARSGSRPTVAMLLEAGADPSLSRNDGCTALHLCAANNLVEIARLLITVGCADVNAQLGYGNMASSLEGTPLHAAAEAGHIEFIQLLATNLSDLDQRRESDESTGLLVSLYNEFIEAVELLLYAQADPNLADSNEAPPVIWASQSNLTQVVRLLIRSGADVGQQLQDGFTALHSAAQDADMKLLTLLLNAQAPLDVQEEDGSTSLYFAAQSGHEEVLATLISAAADIDLSQKNMSTPLYIACQNGHVATAEFLIRSAADANQQLDDDCTPLYAAAQNNNLAVVNALINSRDVEIDRAQFNKASPLYVASMFGHSNVVAALINAGADLNLRQGDGATPALIASQEGKLEVLKRLIFAGADVDDPGLLSQAAQDNRQSVVDFLIAAQTDVDLRPPEGDTPLYMGAQNGHTEIVWRLLRAGANADYQKVTGTTPINISCQQDFPDIVLALLTAQADPELARHTDGSTPMLMAAMLGHSEIVAALIDWGANVDHCGHDGTSPLDSAVLEKKHKVQQMLRKAEAKTRYEYDGDPHKRDTSIKEPQQTTLGQLQLSQSKHEHSATDLHKAMIQAGFHSNRALMQSAIAQVLQDIQRRRIRQQTFIVGSFAEGWGNSLSCLAGVTDLDSDIDVTQFMPGKLYHIKGFCRCDDPDPTRMVEYINGHVLSPGSSDNPAKPDFSSALRPSVDRVTAYQCCCYPNIEILRPDRATQFSAELMKSLRVVHQTSSCHVVTAAPTGMAGKQLRVSTTFFEKVVLQSLSTVQGQLFILLKYLIKRVLTPMVMGLKTYLVKTLIFRMLDVTPPDRWNSANLIQLINSALRMLQNDLLARPKPDECMTHFFLSDAAVYLKKDHSDKAKISGAIESALLNLSDHLTSFTSELTKPGDQFFFHPFQILPVLATAAPKRSGVFEYHEVYDAVHDALMSLSSSPQSWDAQALIKLIDRIPDCAQTARESLRVMAHLKQRDRAGAVRVLQAKLVTSQHQVSRSLRCTEDLTRESANAVIWRHLLQTDSAWRFCFILLEKFRFEFLAEFFTLFPVQLSNHRGLYYINFDCLLKCLYLELLPHATETCPWFAEVIESEFVDEQEALMVFNYCADVAVLIKATLKLKHESDVLKDHVCDEERRVKEAVMARSDTYCHQILNQLFSNSGELQRFLTGSRGEQSEEEEDESSN